MLLHTYQIPAVDVAHWRLRLFDRLLWLERGRNPEDDSRARKCPILPEADILRCAFERRLRPRCSGCTVCDDPGTLVIGGIEARKR